MNVFPARGRSRPPRRGGEPRAWPREPGRTRRPVRGQRAAPQRAGPPAPLEEIPTAFPGTGGTGPAPRSSTAPTPSACSADRRPHLLPRGAVPAAPRPVVTVPAGSGAGPHGGHGTVGASRLGREGSRKSPPRPGHPIPVSAAVGVPLFGARLWSGPSTAVVRGAHALLGKPRGAGGRPSAPPTGRVGPAFWVREGSGAASTASGGRPTPVHRARGWGRGVAAGRQKRRGAPRQRPRPRARPRGYPAALQPHTPAFPGPLDRRRTGAGPRTDLVFAVVPARPRGRLPSPPPILKAGGTSCSTGGSNACLRPPPGIWGTPGAPCRRHPRIRGTCPATARDGTAITATGSTPGRTASGSVPDARRAPHPREGAPRPRPPIPPKPRCTAHRASPSRSSPVAGTGPRRFAPASWDRRSPGRLFVPGRRRCSTAAGGGPHGQRPWRSPGACSLAGRH